MVKELAEEFHGQFECLKGNTEKFVTFSVTSTYTKRKCK